MTVPNNLYRPLCLFAPVPVSLEGNFKFQVTTISSAWEGHLVAEGAEGQPVLWEGKKIDFQQR